MNRKEVIELKKQIIQHLSKRQIKEAIDTLTNLTIHASDWKSSENLSELETNYKYMLHYFFEGVEDPERQKLLSNLLRSLYELTDDTSDEILKSDSPNIFYEKLRIENIKQSKLDNIVIELEGIIDSMALIELVDDVTEKQLKKRDLSIRRERLDSDFFNTIFVSSRASESDAICFNNIINNIVLPSREKCLLISALTLNLFHRFDSRKAQVLMQASLSEERQVRARAIVGLVVVMQMYDIRWELYPELQYQLDTLSEDNTFRKTILNVIIQLIRSRETERISKKITEEIIPEMMKISSLSGRKLSMDELMGDGDLTEKNPEWKKELEESGLSKKLQEYSNLQMEGADVFHSTFSSLKNYPFFSDLNNWFMPFDTSYSEIQELFTDTSQNSIIQAAIVDSGHMCNSDKYSFCLSLLRIPSSQREMMMHRMGSESEDIKEMQNETKGMNPAIDDEIISNQYIQDLYRFFKIYTNRNSFFDMFKLSLTFYKKKSISPIISNAESMKKIATYCFEKNNFEEALDIFERLAILGDENSDLWQKVGYCKQMLNDHDGALKAYLQADLFTPNNSWILRRIANIYRLLNKQELALEYYKKAATLLPDNMNIEMQIGHCHLDMKQYENALNSYFKVELMDSTGTKSWRPIAWVAFLMKKIDLSKKYYQLILANKPTVHDYLNAGHVELCIGNKRSALEYYISAAQTINNMNELITLFESDKPTLIENGIDNNVFSYIFDQIKYKLN